jgi:hypothetical protein
MINANVPLTHEEFASMQEIGKVMQRIILPAHCDLLISLGYITHDDGCLRLTNAGRKRLATNK